MTVYELTRLRLHRQQLDKPVLTKAGEVVSLLGAVQAQDYLGALWSVGQRMKKATEADIEDAIINKTIVRTWPMRGTLHFVSPKDARWMLRHLTPRIFSRMKSQLRQAEIDNKVIAKSKKLWIKALEGGKQLTRDEMYSVLERGKIATDNIRGLHLLGIAAQDGLICFGPRKGKQHTFTLLDEWLPTYPMLERDEALGELAKRYFSSHGPATIEDFMWWVGVTKKDAVAGLESIKSKLDSAMVEGNVYWFVPSTSIPKIDTKKAYLLPTYDEFGIAYKDRSAIISASDYKKIGSFFTSFIVVNGTIIGTWKRTLKKDIVTVEVKPFRTFSAQQKKSIIAAVKQYAKFISLSPEIQLL